MAGNTRQTNNNETAESPPTSQVGSGDQPVGPKEPSPWKTTFHGPPMLAPNNLSTNLDTGFDEDSGSDDDFIHIQSPYSNLLLSPEHCLIGNNITLLNSEDGSSSTGRRLKLRNGLELTYGEINFLAGDYYGTDQPISQADNLDDRKKRFQCAFWTLGENDAALNEAKQIISDVRNEIDAVNQAIQNDQDPSTLVYAEKGLLGWLSWARDLLIWEKDTASRPKNPIKTGYGTFRFPDYYGLLETNFDHFGEDARAAYTAGHAVALEAAASGDLDAGYAYNAFADHFLQDSFSAGHLRTPRKYLTGFLGSLCANRMHEEDNAIGLNVTNADGMSWRCYGDGRFLDKEDLDNKKICMKALQISADEITEAFELRRLPHPTNQALDHAPSISSAMDRSQQKLQPLFTVNDDDRNNKTILVRDDISCRREGGHSAMPWWLFNNETAWYSEILLKCWNSGKWKEPIRM